MKIVGGIILALALLLFALPVFAQSDVDKRIEELKQKINELQSQENTLAKQISLLDSNIALTTLKITNIKDAIVKLSGEIDELTTEIERIEVLLTKRSELVLRRIPATYKRQVIPQFGLLLFSQNFSDFLARVKYLATVQEQDAELLFQLKATQNHFGERKALREEKRAKQLTLQKELEAENRKLTTQKKEKQNLVWTYLWTAKAAYHDTKNPCWNGDWNMPSYPAYMTQLRHHSFSLIPNTLIHNNNLEHCQIIIKSS